MVALTTYHALMMRYCKQHVQRFSAVLDRSSIQVKKKHFKNDMDDDTLMAMTSTGYIDNTLGLLWLQHFNKMTKMKLKEMYKLLLLDEQFFYITEEVVVYCWLNKIVLFLLSPYITHLL